MTEQTKSDWPGALKSLPRLFGLASDNLEAVELANAYGPYAHGTWVSQELAVGNEEALAGRGAFLVSQIRRAILDCFTVDQIRGMSLVDVGCYDGWLICQLEDLPFARLIGVEPRMKNLEKGRVIRQLLGIETRCEFRQGSIDNLENVLDGLQADVVTCTGLFHHLTSAAVGVTALRTICRQLLFLETICFPGVLDDESLRRGMELKDLPYFFGNKGFGVSGHKLESGYYDGSATHLSVVSLPSVSALGLFLDVGGFEDIRVVVDPDAYAQAVVVEEGRSYSAVCITAHPRQESIDPSLWIEKYECGVLCTLIPLNVAQVLYRKYCLHEEVSEVPALAALVLRTISGTSLKQEEARNSLQAEVSDSYLFEIYKNLRFAPHDKIALEYGKCLVASGNYEDGERVLFCVTKRMNADWRAVYRSFCVIAWSSRARGAVTAADRYEELCFIANPQFPSLLLRGGVGMFNESKNEYSITSRG